MYPVFLVRQPRSAVIDDRRSEKDTSVLIHATGDISSKRHDFVSIDENGSCRLRLAPQCLHSPVMFIIREHFFLEDEELCCWIFQSLKKKKMRFELLAFALLSHFFRTDVASHCWHSHCWHSHFCLIRTVDPFALLAFALLASHWCPSHFCLSHSCRTSLLRGQASFEISACNRVEVIQDRGTCFERSEWKALGSWTLEVRLNANLF